MFKRFLASALFFAFASALAGCKSGGVLSLDSSSANKVAPSAPSSFALLPGTLGKTTSPSVTGVAQPNINIFIYSDLICSTLLGSGTTDANGAFSIALNVPANTTTAIFATAQKGTLNSACINSLLAYTEDSLAPAPPVLTASSPQSPSTDTHPTISGTAEANSSIKLYTNSSCTTLLASGTANGSGNFSIATTVPTDATTSIYATATDAVGNTSSCSSAPFIYQEQSTCTGALWPFVTQLGGGVQTQGLSIIHGSCASYVAGANSINAGGTGFISGATEYGTGGNSGVSVILSKFDFLGNPVWTSEYAMTNAIAHVAGVVQDSSGNFYVGGYVSCVVGQTCSFGGTLTGTDGLNSTGNSNGFIIKFDSNGVLQWVRQLGGGTMGTSKPTLLANAIAIDSSANVYLAGGAYNNLGGTMTGVHGLIDAFVAKYDSSGAFGWVNQLGNDVGSTYVAYGASVDPSGNIDISGQATGALLNDQLSFTSHGFTDVFAAQFNAAGANAWSIQIGFSGNMWGNGLQTDASGNLLVSGYTDGLLTAAPISATQYGTHGNKDAFILEINKFGGYLWTTQYGALGASMITSGGNALSQDGLGNYYLAGQADNYLGGTCYFACNNATSAFVTKIASTGAFGWVTQAGPIVSGSTVGVTTDSSGNSYFTTMVSSLIGHMFGTHLLDLFYASVDSTGGMNLTAASPTANTLTWPLQAGAAAATTQGLGLVQDAGGNSFITGKTSGSLGGTQYGTHGTYDVIIAKFDSTGAKKWINQLGAGGATTIGQGITGDGAGNSYVTGQTDGVVGTQQGVHGTKDLFLAAFDAAGGSTWTIQYGATGATLNPTAVVRDGTGNLFVTGTTDTYLGGTQTGVHGTLDAFIAKFNSTGTLQWINQFGVTGGSVTANSLAINGTGDLYLAGTTNTSLGATQYGSTGSLDLFVLKYASTGAFTWALELGAGGTQTGGYGVTVDGGGNVVVAGNTTGSLGGTQYGSHGTTDIVLASFSATGALNWANQLGAYTPCLGGEACNGMLQATAFGRGVILGADGNFYVSGFTTGMVPNASQFGSHGTDDALVAQFSATGVYQWSSQIGMTNAVTEGLAIAVSNATGSKAVLSGYSDSYLNGAQFGTHGTNDFILFRTDQNGVLP